MLSKRKRSPWYKHQREGENFHPSMNTIHSEEKTTISHYLNDGSCTLYVEYDYKISIHSLSNELSVALFKITLHIFAYDWHPFI